MGVQTSAPLRLLWPKLFDGRLKVEGRLHNGSTFGYGYVTGNGKGYGYNGNGFGDGSGYGFGDGCGNGSDDNN